MYIESPVSGKVAAINILRITGDKINLEIIIISKDPFQKSKRVSKQNLREKVLIRFFRETHG